MAKFQYVGDGKDSPESIKFMGAHRFYLKGAYVEVEDEHIIQKLSGNKCFKVKAEKKAAPKKAVKKKSAKKQAVDSGDDNGST